MKNLYEQAILNGETKYFLLGRGEYFFLNRDWGGHDHTTSGMYILAYSHGIPCGDFITRLNADISSCINDPGLSKEEFASLLGLIYFYHVYYYQEKKFECEWKVPKNIIDAIQNVTKYGWMDWRS
ncbi:MAG: hypothetical protein L6Q81_16465 [Bacteroidia bacterium]|nr:hypothetical protein [Bacteroidia bacterium]